MSPLYSVRHQEAKDIEKIGDLLNYDFSALAE